MTALVLFSEATHPISKTWLEGIAPTGATVREVSLSEARDAGLAARLPGFLIDDADGTVGVQVLPPKMVDETIGSLAGSSEVGFSEALTAKLEASPLVLEVDVMKDPGDKGLRHPLLLRLTKALSALACSFDDGRIFDENLEKLSDTFGVPHSGAPPYDPDGPIDFRTFRFASGLWFGTADIPWLGGDVEITVECEVNPIPLWA